jgi:hypothetical protein
VGSTNTHLWGQVPNLVPIIGDSSWVRKQNLLEVHAVPRSVSFGIPLALDGSGRQWQRKAPDLLPGTPDGNYGVVLPELGIPLGIVGTGKEIVRRMLQIGPQRGAKLSTERQALGGADSARSGASRRR